MKPMAQMTQMAQMAYVEHALRVLFAAVFLTLSGCAVIDAVTPEDKVTGLSQQAADDLIAQTVGTVKPRDLQLDPFFEERFSTVTDTSFQCNNSSSLNRVTTFAITRQEGNYIEITAASVEDCDRSINHYKLSGRYNGQWLYLKRPEDRTTYVFAYEIKNRGGALRSAFVYKIVNGKLTYYPTIQAGEKRSNGGYYLTTGFVSIDDLRASIDAQRDILMHGGNNSGSSTASQLALFGNIFADKLRQQQNLKNSEALAGRQRERDLLADNTSPRAGTSPAPAAKSGGTSTINTTNTNNGAPPTATAAASNISKTAGASSGANNGANNNGAKPQAAAAPKDEGHVATNLEYDEQLTEKQSKTWCQKRVAALPKEFAEMKSPRPNQLISIGKCSCKPVEGSDFGLKIFEKLYRCEVPVTARLFKINDNSR